MNIEENYNYYQVSAVWSSTASFKHMIQFSITVLSCLISIPESLCSNYNTSYHPVTETHPTYFVLTLKLIENVTFLKDNSQTHVQFFFRYLHPDLK